MHSDITFDVEIVTPEVAKEYLKESRGNRRIRTNTVESYKRDLLNGGFGLTHQGIAFDTKGRLVDGHHRLLAIAESGIPGELVVCRNLPDDAVNKIDRGLSRSIADIFKIKECADELPASMRMLTTARGTSVLNQLVQCNYKKLKLSANEYDWLYSEFKDPLGEIYDSVTPKNITSVRAPMLSAAVAAVSDGVDASVISKFFKVFCNDDISGCDGYNVSAALNWKRQMDDAKIHKTHIDRKKLYLCTQNAIYHFANNTGVQRVQEPASYRYDMTERIKGALHMTS